MDKFTATVEAESRADALEKAAALLGVSDDNMDLLDAGPGMFMAVVKNLDAQLLISVTDDNMAAVIKSAYRHLGEGRPFDKEIFDAALVEANVAVAPVSGALEHILKSLEDGTELVGFHVVEGKPAIDGWDGVVELKVKTDMSVGEADERNRLDYRERGFVETVNEGDVLGAVTHATEGNPGLDVYGSVVAAHSGKDPIFEAGEHVRVSEQGKIVAEKSGMVRYVHSVLSITEVFEHMGDVDYHTGNIHMDTGSISIRGTVFPGFEVSASGNVVVTETIKEAKIIGGGDIEIKQGIIDSTLEAQGSICAQYVQNSKLVAQGDIVIANNLHNGDILAGDNVLVKTGKGIVRGGIIRCSKMLEAKEIGSASEVETLIELGNRTEEENGLILDRAAVIDAISEINLFLGCEDGVPDMSGKTEKEQQGILKVLETLKLLQIKKTELESVMAAKTKERLSRCEYRVIVLTRVFPGVEISILGRKFVVRNQLKKCYFSYDSERDKVVAHAM